MAIDIRRVTRLVIGIQTEEGVEEIAFDLSPWKKEFPGLTTFQLNVTPPDGGATYIASTRMEGDYLIWPIAAQDTAIPGRDGWYEIEAVGEEMHKLTPRRPLIVYPRLNGATGPAPEPMESWLRQAAEIRDETSRAALRAEEAADRAEGSGGGAGGGDGGYYIPSIDPQGVLSWTASQADMPAVSPANIMGPQGPQGPQGNTGDTGPAGAEGKTPVRGTDYWTEADIAQIKGYVEEAILGGAW